MGRLALRQALAVNFNDLHFEFVHINEAAGDASTAAHLLLFDSVHGRVAASEVSVHADSATAVRIGERTLGYSSSSSIEDGDWSGIDVVLDCTGAHRSAASFAPYINVPSTQVIDGSLVELLGWYDNEIGYVARRTLMRNCLRDRGYSGYN